MQKKLNKLVNSIGFSVAINLVILINAALIGIETFHSSLLIYSAQRCILGIFTIEIVLRYVGKNSVKDYIMDGWNIFDILIVGVCYIPESLLASSAAISVFRIMRIFRILRLTKTFPELRVIITVLLRSIKSLSYTTLLLLIFMYMYSIIGVTLFKGGPTVYGGQVGPQNPDPYGSISEGFFTLFRILTGEDWTDLRYNLLGGQIPGAADWIVTLFHVSWMGIAAFLLINLVVGAVVNNYDQVMEEKRKEEGGDRRVDNQDMGNDIEALNNRIDLLNKKIDNLLKS
jgi:voltage-gated sodium channel